MSVLQGLRQQSVRDLTGTALDYNSDWSALFDDAGIAAGPWNGRLLAWINNTLGTSYAGLPAAQQAFAVSRGYANWSSMGDFLAGSGLLLEGDMADDATDFLLLEGNMADDASDFLLLEGDMA